MKKILVLALACLLTASFVACAFQQTITVPVDIAETGGFDGESDSTDEFIANIQKIDGVSGITMNADGSVTLRVSKEFQDTLRDQMRHDVELTVESMLNGEDAPSVRDVTYNEDMSEVVVQVNRAEFESSLDTFAVFGLGIGAYYFQVADGKAVPKLVIRTVDVDTGEEIEAMTLPDDFAQEGDEDFEDESWLEDESWVEEGSLPDSSSLSVG